MESPLPLPLPLPLPNDPGIMRVYILLASMSALSYALAKLVQAYRSPDATALRYERARRHDCEKALTKLTDGLGVLTDVVIERLDHTDAEHLRTRERLDELERKGIA